MDALYGAEGNDFRQGGTEFDTCYPGTADAVDCEAIVPGPITGP